MSLLDPLPWNAGTPPTFVNEKGIKFWPDRSLTDWARREDQFGTKLSDAMIWYVEHPNGTRTQLLALGQAPEHETTGMEDMATHIDLLKAARRFKA